MISGGYFQTDANFNPLTRRFLEMENYSTTLSIREFTEILKIRYKNEKGNEEYFWGSWVPTTNTIMIKIAKLLLQEIELSIINPEIYCNFAPQIKIHNQDRKLMVIKKYQPKKINYELKYLIENKNGIIIDDLYHHGYTIARIMELLSSYKVKKILGIVIVRTTGRKGIKIKYFPK